MKQFLTLLLLFLGSFYSLCQPEALVVSEQFDEEPIEEVFKVLKEKYNLKIAYDYQDVKDIIITQNITKLSLNNALEVIFASAGLEHQIKEERVLVRRPSKNSSEEILTQTKRKRIISGQIVDKKTGKPLEFATIYSKADNQGTQVDEKGVFKLTIQSNESQGELVIQHLGYLPKRMYWQDKTSANFLTISLASKSHEFETITITERLPTLSTSKAKNAISINADQLNTLPAFVGGSDIMRNIQLLPGISADDDLSAELRVRGSNGDENMVILDGITLYKVDHFFGIFSAINSRMVNQVNVYKNAFPAQYGGRTASVIEFTTEGTPVSKISGGFDINLLTSSADFQLPVGENMVVQLAGRLTNKNVASTDLFNVLNQEMKTPAPRNLRPNRNNNNQPSLLTTVSRDNVVAYEPNFKFYDFNAKWAWKITPTTNFSAHYFQGYDEFDYNYSQEYTVGGKGRARTLQTEQYEEQSDWLNRGISGKIEQYWSEYLSSQICVAYSTYEDRTQSLTNLTKVDLRKDDRPVPNTKDTTTLVNNNYNDIQGTDISFKNTLLINPQQQFVFGYNYLKNELAIDLAVDDQSILDGSPVATQHALFGQYEVSLLEDQWKVSAGLRGTHYSITNQLYWSPRLSTWFQANDNLQLKGSWSRYNQFLRRNYYEDRFGRSNEFWVLGNDKRFPVAEATNWMLGFNFLNEHFELDVEYFQKNTEGIIEYAQTTVGLNVISQLTNSQPYKIFEGNRLSRGLDVLLKKSGKNYSSWLAYTLSKTTNSFKAIRKGESYPSKDDRRHQLKWVNQYRFKQFDFSATYVYSSGRPYTDLSNFTDNPKDRGGTSVTDQINYLESYQRVDIGATYRFTWNNTKGKIGFSIFNLLNRKNVKYRQYILSVSDPDPEPGKQRPRNTVLGTELQMLDFTPNLSFSLQF